MNSMFDGSVLEGNTHKLLREISTGRRAVNKGTFEFLLLNQLMKQQF
jgi:hypothetical protein